MNNLGKSTFSPEISPSYLNYLLINQNNPVLENAITLLHSKMQTGNSCLNISELAEELRLPTKSILEEVRKSTLVADISFDIKLAEIPNIPLLVVKTGTNYLLYMNRYFYYEKKIADNLNHLQVCPEYSLEQLKEIESITEILSTKSIITKLPNIEQLNSINESLRRKFSIITGGPGTGKTTSVIFLLWAFQQIYSEDIKINICAPTGKAAKRVRESLLGNIKRIEDSLGLEVHGLIKLIENQSSFGTIHKMLGYLHNSIHFKHNGNNKLDADILIIDESSMIGLPLFYKLLEAINPGKVKHVIFLGDPNQLSSVEEGFVFSSLVNYTSNNKYLSRLKISNRNQGDIGRLATAVLNLELDNVKNILTGSDVIRLYQPLSNLVVDAAVADSSNLIQLVDLSINAEPGVFGELFSILSMSSILCMTNIGDLGTNSLNQRIEARIKQRYKFEGNWFPGRIIIILENDSTSKLFNGDIGICIIHNNRSRIVFDDGRSFIPEVLPKYELAYAITIHKSQGSEYSSVSIVIPPVENKILNKELVYTAITRAKVAINIYSRPETIVQAIQTDSSRISGLKEIIK